MNMDVTVIICTYNRCATLPKALESVAASIMPPAVSWEVLVVDNNSNDNTRETVEDFGRRYPGRFRYLFESRAGKSYGLNAGISAAQGEIIAFMDDDLVVESAWLQNLTASLRGTEWAGVGGRTLPAEAFSPPRWLSFGAPYYLGGILCAYFDYGDSPCVLSQAPYGANMAYRKSMFAKYGLFRTDLGPSPNAEVPRPNEDTEFGRRLMAAGERLRYEPAAVARHPVPLERVNKKYFLRWWFDYGRADMREVGRRPDIWGIPRPYLSFLKYATVLVPTRTARWFFSLKPQDRFYNKCWVWKTVGEITEIYRRSFGGNSKAGRAMRAQESSKA